MKHFSLPFTIIGIFQPLPILCSLTWYLSLLKVITISLEFQIFYHQFNKEEQLTALEAEKMILEERKKLKEEGVIGSTMDALDGAASVVGSSVGMVGTGVTAGAGLVGSGIGAGAGLVGSGFGAGAGLVGSGLGAVGSGLSRAGKFMGRTITGQGASRRSGSNTPINNVEESGGGAKPR